MARWKARVDFLLTVFELLFLSLAVDALQGKTCPNSLLFGGGESELPNISGDIKRDFRTSFKDFYLNTCTNSCLHFHNSCFIYACCTSLWSVVFCQLYNKPIWWWWWSMIYTATTYWRGPKMLTATDSLPHGSITETRMCCSHPATAERAQCSCTTHSTQAEVWPHYCRNSRPSALASSSAEDRI